MIDYMTLFPGYTREKPRFAALAESVLQQVYDLMELIPELNEAFSLSQAAGVRLDALGASFNISRPNNCPDESYRSILLRKLKRNRWNGLDESAFEYVEEGETFFENGNGTVTAVTNEAAAPQEILPVPIGVKAI